jgi:RNA polymerase sigma-70 factor (ECF subfamily)
VIWKITGRPSLIPDLCQETFVIAIDKIRKGDLREHEKLSGFMVGIARVISLAYLRDPQNREIGIDEGVNLNDMSPNQHDHLLREEITMITRQTINSLKSARDREVLYRYYIEEDDKEQICSDLGLSNSRFNVVLCRAKKQFEKLYRKTITKRQRKS